MQRLLLTVLALVAVTLASANVDVTVYYESKCPGCKALLTSDSFEKTVESFDAVTFDLIPFGNARMADDGSITCQHGAAECTGNIYHACAITHYPEFSQHFGFIKCMESSHKIFGNPAKDCAAKAGLDFDVIDACANSDEGIAAHQAMGKKTGDHSFVPWIMVNGVVVQNQNDLNKMICEAYEGEVPAACADIMEADSFDHFCYHEEHLSNGINEDVIDHFNKFVEIFDKEYETEVHAELALTKFHATLLRLAKKQNPAHGVTMFSDMTTQEFADMYLTRGEPRSAEEIAATPKYDGTCHACKRFPEHANYQGSSIDWTTKGAVTGVKNQGQCGSCWAFGTVADIEGTHFLAGNDLVSLSEQQLVSCDTSYGDMGCNGGLPNYAFEYVKAAGGLVLESQYKYTSGGGSRGMCNWFKTHKAKSASISGWVQVSSSASQENSIASALVKSGPLVIGIDAEPMQDYHSGIDRPSCTQQMNHAVTIVGYGTSGGTEFWKIKNSWSTSWGEKGYYRIQKGRNYCGLALDVTHSVAASKYSSLRGDDLTVEM